MKRLPAFIAAVMLSFLALPVGIAHASSFTVSCSYTRSLSDDPIVFPGQPGASHLHDFFGNRTTDANSTYASMQAGTTSCGKTDDKAGYWAPALYVNGVKVNPSALKAYYYARSSNPVTPPADLRMVAGNSHATVTQSTKVMYWGCGSGSGISKVTAPPDCTGHGGKLYAHVLFPYCLNADGTVTYPTCAPGAQILPQLVERFTYPVADARNTTLASGGYWTYHADFWNTWNQAALASLVASL